MSGATARVELRRYANELRELRAALPPASTPEQVDHALADAAYLLALAADALDRLEEVRRDLPF